MTSLLSRGLGVVAVLVGVLLNGLAMTEGTAELARPPHRMAQYYDALGDSLAQGRFDVPRSAIGNEAFLIEGRSYGYFGPTPAVIRYPLNRLWPQMRGRWTRPVMLAACAATLLATWLLVCGVRRRMSPAEETTKDRLVAAGFVLAAALGTTLLFISRSPVIYHEASAVAVAFAMWTFVFVLRYEETSGHGALLGSLLCGLASFQARGSVGAGALLAVGLLVLMIGWRALRSGDGRLGRQAVVFGVVAAVSTGAVLYKNLSVYGNLSGAPPLHRHVLVMNNPNRLALTGGDLVQPRNLRTTLYNYLHPRQFRFEPKFPWFHAQPERGLVTFPETRLDHREPFASLTAINPFWVLFAGLGLVLVAWKVTNPFLRIASLGALAGAVPMLLVACITQRYLHDAFPLFVVAGAIGLEWARTKRRLPFVAPVLVLLGLYTCFANAAVTMNAVRWY